MKKKVFSNIFNNLSKINFDFIKKIYNFKENLLQQSLEILHSVYIILIDPNRYSIKSMNITIQS